MWCFALCLLLLRQSSNVVVWIEHATEVVERTANPHHGMISSPIRPIGVIASDTPLLTAVSLLQPVSESGTATGSP